MIFDNQNGLFAVIVVREALARIVKNDNRASKLIGRIRDLIKKTGPFTNVASLLRHHFIDPDARYVRIALRNPLGIINALGAHDREARNGIKA